jgi:enoyl-[acyl-carrier protein] reductase II
VLQSIEGDTAVILKQLTPVRLIKNSFYNQIREAELRGANVDELKLLLGKSRSKLGIFQGDLNEGELEIGQIASSITKIEPAANIVSDIWMEYQSLRRNLENNPTS